MPERKSVTAREVGARIRSLREAHHDSQEKLAQTLNVSRELISKIESGGQFPSVVVLAHLSMYYLVSTDFMLFGDGHKSDVMQQLDQVILTLKSLQRQL